MSVPTVPISDPRCVHQTLAAIEWISRHCGEVRHLQVEAEPRPESLRAAIRGKHAILYKGKLYDAFLSEAVRQLAAQRPNEPLNGDLIGVAEIISTKPKTTKRARPKGDVDNLVKGVLDALTQSRCIVDDDNLMSLVIGKRWALPEEKAGVRICIGRLDPPE
ncbi:RusA family crossover junction endodeoxyribonuclease [Candidatus Kirkpatrickella diaphorinae]|uniref:RusA family crossover junction endodeoxyribonuclease n=1 Tax=Candidatus Kirkpatrickella diaphorinae TaxID=2984322 RepID=A0ABY6GGF7_9PROT|nr:RusA family crossover junction endodeoxyribonuclease [Candidatus Kirkpatrickella diaphorinae]UYH50583.1 RusA family crossover junction endodeoxyribonuclease [Candidatus Kirkpatrickella diaphorinae]